MSLNNKICFKGVKMFNKYIVMNKGYSIHYFGDICFLNNVSDNESINIDLDEVGTDIVELCDGITDLKSLYETISIEYNLDKDDVESKELLLQFIDIMLKKGILELKDTAEFYKPKTTGVRGKMYPFLLILEITDMCNLRCRHCYKDGSSEEYTFLHYEDIKEIFQFFKGKTPILNIIGGEPLLHPKINEILEEANKDFNVILISNGTKLDLIKDKNIQGLRSAQISMYGYDEESYKKATGNTIAFNGFYNGIKAMKKNNTNTSVAIIVNKDNFEYLEKYIEVLISLQVDEIKFGLAALHGRAIKDKERWTFSQAELRNLQKSINIYNEKYKGIIDINIWGDDDYIYDSFRDTQCRKTDKYTLNCIAGKKNITISEKGRVRPCNFLPSEVFDMGFYKDYLKNIEKGEEFSFRYSMIKYEELLSEHGIKLSDIRCEGFS